MKIKSARFHVSAPGLEECPNSMLPEFAFIGRSNVGKSSLINLLAEKRDLAKVSDTPGKTKLINFFTMNEKWSLVDLPGYGYAAVNKGDREQFNQAVGDYLEERENIRWVFVLIDSRLPPQRIDLDFIRWLSGCGVPFVLVFTKADKQSAAKGLENVALFKHAMSEWTAVLPQIFITSVKTKSGRTEILSFIEKSMATPAKSDLV